MRPGNTTDAAMAAFYSILAGYKPQATTLLSRAGAGKAQVLAAFGE
jgi:hypothetical protein